MHKGIAIAAVATAGLLVSTAAQAQSRDFDLTGFDKIDIATGLDARVTQGESFSVHAVSRSQQALDNLQLTVDGGVLSARLEQNFLDFIISGGLVGMLFSSGNAVSLEITLPELSAATASSGADIDLLRITSPNLVLDASSGADISADNAVLGTVHINSSSGADVEISGTADAVEADASSGAGIDADDLIAKSVIAQASSGAGLSVHATVRIRAEASSGGDIEISGNPPERDVDSSSGGDVSFED